MSYPRNTRAPHRKPWLKAGLLSAALLLGALRPVVALEPPPEPIEETEGFMAASAAGTLTLPLGAPDRQTPAIVILQDGEAPDGRASLYTDQLLGAGFAVLELVHRRDEALETVLNTLAMHPRVAGQKLGLLAFGAGARAAAALPEPVAARALLYPGCDGIIPASMPAQQVLLMHGGEDVANEPWYCEDLAASLTEAGATVRLRVLPGASYAWDLPPFRSEGQAMLPRPDGAGRVRVEPWPELAVLSAAEVAGFFATALLGHRP